MDPRFIMDLISCLACLRDPPLNGVHYSSSSIEGDDAMALETSQWAVPFFWPIRIVFGQ